MSGLRLLSFTERGKHLAERLGEKLGGQAFCTRDRENFSLRSWTEEAFASGDDLIFVGAVGIAVRAVAPFLKSKAQDPAVVAVDEGGSFAVPLVSGHLGGANALAKRAAAVCGAVPVITTATDVNGAFAVDLWAKKRNLTVMEPERIKLVSSKILAGVPARVRSCCPVDGEMPAGVLPAGETWDFEVGLFRTEGEILHLVPGAAVLGVGCRKGTPAETLERAFSGFCGKNSLFPQSICAAATIDLKAEEQGLLDFCKAHGWPLSVFSAEELNGVEGTFTPSEFVKKTTGVDNVCERSCVLCSGGTLAVRKYAGDGVTFALAMKPLKLDWSWKDE